MPSVGRTLALDHPLYGMAKLIDTGATFAVSAFVSTRP
jgi:hypothetical protein